MFLAGFSYIVKNWITIVYFVDDYSDYHYVSNCCYFVDNYSGVFYSVSYHCYLSLLANSYYRHYFHSSSSSSFLLLLLLSYFICSVACDIMFNC